MKAEKDWHLQNLLYQLLLDMYIFIQGYIKNLNYDL